MSSQFNYGLLPIDDFFKVAADQTCRWVSGIKKGLRVAIEHIHGFLKDGVSAYSGAKMDLPGATIAGLKGEDLSGLVSAANMIGNPVEPKQTAAVKVEPKQLILPEAPKQLKGAKTILRNFLTLNK